MLFIKTLLADNCYSFCLIGEKGMDIMEYINQAKDIMINPKKAMKGLKDKKISRNDILFYAGILNIFVFISIFIEYFFVWDAGIGGSLSFAFLLYILSVAGVIIFGYLLYILAPMFKAKQNKMQAMKLGIYVLTPMMIAGIFNAIQQDPVPLILIFLAGIYGLFILYHGLPIFMEVPKENHMSFFVIALIILFVGWGIINGIWIVYDTWWYETFWTPSYEYMM